MKGLASRWASSLTAPAQPTAVRPPQFYRCCLSFMLIWHSALTRSIAELENDAAVKTHSLNLENQAMQQRQQFKYRLIGQ